MEPHSAPNDLYRGLHCGPDSRFLNTLAQAPLPPKCSTLLHLLSSNLCLFVLIYSSLSIRPYLFVLNRWGEATQRGHLPTARKVASGLGEWTWPPASGPGSYNFEGAVWNQSSWALNKRVIEPVIYEGQLGGVQSPAGD